MLTLIRKVKDGDFTTNDFAQTPIKRQSVQNLQKFLIKKQLTLIINPKLESQKQIKKITN
jgi:hypothetical protein